MKDVMYHNGVLVHASQLQLNVSYACLPMLPKRTASRPSSAAARSCREVNLRILNMTEHMASPSRKHISI